MNVGTAFVEIRPDTGSFGPALSRGVQQGLGPTERQLKSSFRGMARGLGGIIAGVGLVQFFRGAIDEASEAQTTFLQTEAVIESTGGVAGITADHVADLADELGELAAMDNEVIAGGANVLLTFKNIKAEGGVFDRALASATDLAAHPMLGGDMASAARMVGRALNDPIRGMTALTRAGIQFDDSQKQAIEQMVAFGNTAGAQEIILQELEDQLGGTAEANVTAADEMTVAWDDMKESVGESLIPVMEDLAPVLKSAADGFAALPAPVQTTTVAVIGLSAALSLLSSAGILGGLATAGKAIAAIALSPIGILVAGLAATLAIMYGVFRLTEPLRNGFVSAFNAAREGLARVQQISGPVLSVLRSIGNIGLDRLRSALNTVVSVVSKIPGVGQAAAKVIGALGGMALGGLQGALNGILSLLQRAASAASRLMDVLRGAQGLAGSVGGAIPSGPPGKAAGGPVTAGMPYIVGERGPELFMPSHSGNIIPNHALSGGGGGFTAHLYLDGREVAWSSDQHARRDDTGRHRD